MQVKSIAECSIGEHSAILSTFIKLPFVIMISVLSIYEWPFYTGFTVQSNIPNKCTPKSVCYPYTMVYFVFNMLLEQPASEEFSHRHRDTWMTSSKR